MKTNPTIDQFGAFARSNTSGLEKLGSLASPLLRKKELADFIGVSARTIETWIAEKKIPRLRFSARLTRFCLPDVLTAIARYEVKEVGCRL